MSGVTLALFSNASVVLPFGLHAPGRLVVKSDDNAEGLLTEGVVG
jgi:hypothetical protein